MSQLWPHIIFEEAPPMDEIDWLDELDNYYKACFFSKISFLQVERDKRRLALTQAKLDDAYIQQERISNKLNQMRENLNNEY